MSSFTDQKQRIATVDECNANWGGHGKGKAFRCYLCGYTITPGDKWRWIYGKDMTNFMICEKCDIGTDEEIRDKMKKIIEESRGTLWWLWLELESWIKDAQNSLR
jgi:hypothetical protein